MNIVWATKKALDVTLDVITYIETVKSFEKLGHNLVLITSYRSRKPTFAMKGKIKYIPMLNLKYLAYLSFNVSLFFALIFHLFVKRPDFLIIDHNSWAAILPLTLVRKTKIIRTKILLDIRTFPCDGFGISGKFRYLFFACCIFCGKHFFDGITVISPFMKKVISRKFNIQERRIGVWTSGVSLDLFSCDNFDLESTLKEDLNLRDKFVVIYHGTFEPKRGLEETIKAIDLLKEKAPGIVFLLVGDGPERLSLDDLVNRLKLGKRVFIHGPVSYEKMPSYIALADVGIIPLHPLIWWRVSSPLKLIEYLAMGKPAIVTELEAHRDIIGTKSFGIFISHCRPTEIANAILEAYRKRQHLHKIGREARNFVEKFYTWNEQASRLEKYLKSLF